MRELLLAVSRKPNLCSVRPMYRFKTKRKNETQRKRSEKIEKQRTRESERDKDHKARREKFVT